MKKSKRLKRVSLYTGEKSAEAHDRRSTDLTINSVVAPMLVDDPYEEGGKVVVLRSLRDDPLAAMHSAKQLDDAQFMAGRHWQRNRDIAQLGGVSAIDPGKEAVDGGKIAESSITDAQLIAFKEMAQAIKALGMQGNALVALFLDQGLTLRQIAEKWGVRTERERRYIGMRLREALNTLAVVFGYATHVIHRSTQDDVVVA